MWSSPQPATMCSPDSSIEHCTSGSDLERRLRPSTSLGRSLGFLRLHGDAHDGRHRVLHRDDRVRLGPSASASVPALIRYWSMPTMAHVLPHVTILDRLGLAAHHQQVRWMFLM